MRTRTRLFCGLAPFALLLVFNSSCEDKRRHALQHGVDYQATSAPVPGDATPDTIARAFLEAVREAQHARAAGLGSKERKSAYDAAFAKIHSLVAAKEIHRILLQSKSNSLPKDISESAALTNTCESWISLLAHYVDGFRFDTLRNSAQPTEERSFIYLEAANPREESTVLERSRVFPATSAPADDNVRARLIAMGINPSYEAAIDLHLFRTSDGWRVSTVSLGPVRNAPAPVLAPSTQSNSP